MSVRTVLLPCLLAAGCSKEIDIFGGASSDLCLQGEARPSFRCFPIGGLYNHDSPAGPDVHMLAYAGGMGGSCGLQDDRTAVCWDSDDGETQVPSGTWSSIALGSSHGCGIREDGTAECWGTDFYGETHPPAGRFLMLAPVDHYTCGLRPEGTVECWGMDHGEDWTGPPSDVRFVELYGRTATLCGLDASRRVYCWGRDLGTLLSPPEDPGVLRVTVGVRHVCALMADHSIDCWGEDNHEVVSNRPSGEWADVATGQYWSCALATNGDAVHCWGDVAPDQEDFHVARGPRGIWAYR